MLALTYSQLAHLAIAAPSSARDCWASSRRASWCVH